MYYGKACELLVNDYYQKGYDWLDLNSKQEGVRLVGFRYQKGYDWLNSQFHYENLYSNKGKHLNPTIIV
jgi:hypothetical protein